MLRLGLTITTLGVVLLANPAVAQEWKWRFPFTEGSSPELIAYHTKIHATGTLESAKGTRVRDVVWKTEDFELRMDDGVVYLEPEIDGYPAGAFFVGRGAVTFTPEDRRAPRHMRLSFGKGRLEDEPIEHAYIFTLRGQSLLDQLGIEAQSEVAFEARSDFTECKSALRQLGSRLTHAFLNRDGLTEGAAYVLFAPPTIRTRRSRSAYLLYSFDPSRTHEIQLDLFGHRRSADLLPRIAPNLRGGENEDLLLQYYFWPIVRKHSNPRRFVPEGRAERYSTELTLQGEQDVRETTTITLTPVVDVSAFRLRLAPRMQVASVTGPGDRALPFLQWQDRPGLWHPDPHVLVLVDGLLQPGETEQITITSTGHLIQARSKSEGHDVGYEDLWHPRLNDPGTAIFELRAAIPKGATLVAAGELISEEVEDGTRRYHYRTTRPSAATSFYYGNLQTEEETADDTVISAHDVNWGEGSFEEDLEFMAVEIANLVRVFNRILGPLEAERLRVVEFPARHSRAFDEIILLGGRTVDGPVGPVEAHSVASLWWGNLVRPRDLPEDLWLSESFAEYVAYEFLRLRGLRIEREWRRRFWYQPTFWTGEPKTRTLTGEPVEVGYSQRFALYDGFGARSKGPLVLHGLRYLFEVRDGDDTAFWLMLQDVIDQFRYRQLSTREFLEIAEERYGESLEWFWDQWLFGTDLPFVRWSSNLRRTESGNWLLTVEAEQRDTEMILYIPIYIVKSDGETLREPLIMRGKRGLATIELENEPRKVSLNDDFEAIVKLEK